MLSVNCIEWAEGLDTVLYKLPFNAITYECFSENLLAPK